MFRLSSLGICSIYSLAFLFPATLTFAQVQTDYNDLFGVIDRLYDPKVWELPFGVFEPSTEENKDEILAVGFLQEESNSFYKVIKTDLTTSLLEKEFCRLSQDHQSDSHFKLQLVEVRFRRISLQEFFEVVKIESRHRSRLGDIDFVSLARASNANDDSQLANDFLSLSTSTVKLPQFYRYAAKQSYRSLQLGLSDDRFTRSQNRRLLREFLVAFPDSDEATRVKALLENVVESLPGELANSRVELIAQLPVHHQIDELIYKVSTQSTKLKEYQNLNSRSSPENSNWMRFQKESQTPFQQLLDFGLIAFPKLLNCIPNHSSLLSNSDNVDDDGKDTQPVDGSLTQVFELLELISGESFSLSSGEFSTEMARRWWHENQSIGEKQLLRRQINAQTARRYERLYRFISLFPEEASKVLMDAFANWSGPDDKIRLIQMLSQQSITADVESFLRRMLDPSQPVLRIQLAAATALGREPAEHRQLVAAKLTQMTTTKQFTADFEAAVDYLLQTNQSQDDIELIAATFPYLDVDHFRYLLTASNLIHPNVNSDSQVESLLIDLLRNETEYSWTNFEHDGYFYRAPRVCDYALFCLNHRFPDRYRFSSIATKVVRDFQRFECINRYYSLRGKSRVDYPVTLNEAIRVEDSITAKILKEVSTARNHQELKSASSKFRKLGPGAISALEEYITNIDPDSTEFLTLHELRWKLISHVSNVFCTTEEGKIANGIDGLDGLKSESLDFDFLRGLLITTMLDPKFQYDSICLIINRYHKEQGILIHARLGSANPTAEPPKTNAWNISSRSSQFPHSSSSMKLDFQTILLESDLQLTPLSELESIVENPQTECFEFEITFRRQ